MSNITEEPWLITVYPTHELVEFFSIQAIWMFYCVTGKWTVNPGWRLIAFLEGLVCMTINNIWRGYLVYTTSWFMTHLLGKITIRCDPVGMIRLVSFLTWLITDLLTLWYKEAYYGNIACEMAIMSGLIYCRFTRIEGTRARKEKGWQRELIYLSIWAPVWVILFGLCLWGYITKLPILIWFIMFGFLFPKNSESVTSENQAPPLPRRNRESLMGIYETMRRSRRN